MAQKQLGTNPAGDTDIATKAYVDALIGGGSGGGISFVEGTTATAAATAAKVVAVATPESYTPATGDLLAIKFTAGQSAASHTLNINSGGAKPVLAGGVAPVALTAYAGIDGVLFYFYDGTNYHMLGTARDTNTTYSEVSEAEIDAGTASTARAITARRLAYATHWDRIGGKPSTFTPAAHTHNASDVNAGTLDVARMPEGYRAIHVGTSPPSDTTAIWIDTN